MRAPDEAGLPGEDSNNVHEKKKGFQREEVECAAVRI